MKVNKFIKLLVPLAIVGIIVLLLYTTGVIGLIFPQFGQASKHALEQEFSHIQIPADFHQISSNYQPNTSGDATSSLTRTYRRDSDESTAVTELDKALTNAGYSANNGLYQRDGNGKSYKVQLNMLLDAPNTSAIVMSSSNIAK